MIIDAILPNYLLRAGLGLLEDERGRWSYEARDWCANPHYGGCVRLVCVLGNLNETAGYITVGIGYVLDLFASCKAMKHHDARFLR
jgi:hypothetical protein